MKFKTAEIIRIKFGEACRRLHPWIKAGKITGKFLYQGIRGFAGTGLGFAGQATEDLRNLASFITLTKKKEQKLISELEEQSRSYRKLSRREAAEDALIIAGVSMADVLNGSAVIPQDVEKAFELAYPGLAEQSSFAEAAAGLDGHELSGLANGVKGKLFELKYVEDLNGGILPDGFTAELAESPVQAGWDILIRDAAGDPVDALQCKATESAAYVREALERYPGIDVVTTDEVFDRIMLESATDPEGIIGSGIENSDLTEHVLNGLDTSIAGDLLDAKIPILTLLIIGISTYSKRDIPIWNRHLAAGRRSARAALSLTAGGAVISLTGIWWLGIAAAVSSRFLSARGRTRVLFHRDLKKRVRRNRRLIKRMQRQHAFTGIR